VDSELVCPLEYTPEVAQHACNPAAGHKSHQEMTPMRFLFRLGAGVALAAAAFAFAGCRTAAPPSAAWRMSLTMAPTPASSAGDTVFTLKVTDASGRPVNGGTASLDLAMATMDMGPNHVVLAAQGGGGVYRGRGAFLMPGPWRCNVTFTAAGRTQLQSVTVQAN
jgi:hypothetical protein